MSQTIRNGGATSFTIPQVFSDLTGNIVSTQLPGGIPTGTAIKYAIAYASNAANTMAYEAHLSAETF